MKIEKTIPQSAQSLSIKENDDVNVLNIPKVFFPNIVSISKTEGFFLWSKIVFEVK